MGFASGQRRPDARPRRLAIVAGVTAGAIVMALLAACSSNSAGASAEVIAQGGTIYQAQCALCHGRQGEGQPDWKQRGPDGRYPAPPHDSSGHTWHHADADLIEIISRGGQAVYGGPDITSGMPGFGGTLTDGEIAAVLAYIKTFWDEEERAYQEQLNRR